MANSSQRKQKKRPFRPSGILGSVISLGRKRSFFNRIFTTMLLVICIPLMILSITYINEKAATIANDEQKQLDIVTQTVSSRMSDYVDTIMTMDLRVRTNPDYIRLFQNATVSDEMELISFLHVIKASLPFVSECGFYLTSNEALYMTSGKYDVRFYAELVARVSGDEFIENLTGLKKPGFIPGNSASRSFAYVVPYATYAATIPLITGYFQIDALSLTASLKSCLPEPYTLISLAISEGAPLFISAQSNALESGDYMLSSSASAKGIVITVGVPRSHVNESLEGMRAFTRNFITACMLICIGLIFIVARINYTPIKRAFYHVSKTSPTPYRGQGEVKYILDAYNNQIDENKTIEAKLNDEHMALIDKVLERLLLVPNNNYPDPIASALVDNRRLCVACVKSNSVRRLEEIIAKNKADGEIYALELYGEGVVVFLCHVASNDDAGERERLAKRLEGYLCESEDAASKRIGISGVFSSSEQCANAYIEAMRALDPEAARDPLDTDAGAQSEPGKPARAKSPDGEYCYRDSRSEALWSGTNGDESQPSDQEFASRLTKRGEKVHEMIIKYVNENISNPSFGAALVAKHLNVSEYSAGKLLREVYGANYTRSINERRIERAKQLLLSTDEPVMNVAEKVGFLSSSYFIRIFRAEEGVTPLAWRQYMRRNNGNDSAE